MKSLPYCLLKKSLHLALKNRHVYISYCSVFSQPIKLQELSKKRKGSRLIQPYPIEECVFVNVQTQPRNGSGGGQVYPLISRCKTCLGYHSAFEVLNEKLYAFFFLDHIPKKQTGCRLIRPLLHLSRTHSTLFCQHVQAAVYPDKSNHNVQYSRNRIRKQILPSIQLFLNPQVEDSLFHFAELIHQELNLIWRVKKTIVNSLHRQNKIHRTRQVSSCDTTR